jgi:hypothetical protein
MNNNNFQINELQINEINVTSGKINQYEKTQSGRPKSPYFFMQDFKQSLGDGHDPEGQMLAAMILAQFLNQDDKPIYGCWIQGRFWYFTVLIGKDYCVSKPFNATEVDDLLQIVFILRHLKILILNR